MRPGGSVWGSWPGNFEVPDDFDSMGREDIEKLFRGGS